MKPIKAKEVIKIEDGLHKGTIIDVDERETPYHYVDVHIEIEKSLIVVKAGFPASISEMSSLGELLVRFGTKIEADKEYDPEKILNGKKVQFLTTTEKTERGEFARVVPESIKPIQ